MKWYLIELSLIGSKEKISKQAARLSDAFDQNVRIYLSDILWEKVFCEFCARHKHRNRFVWSRLIKIFINREENFSIWSYNIYRIKTSYASVERVPNFLTVKFISFYDEYGVKICLQIERNKLKFRILLCSKVLW